ncbi:U32 family peptidase [Candidatus Woesearchaeota archaeon]|nr:U32 family peptidase [Candidatus Woesearchaeota archaeon]
MRTIKLNRSIELIAPVGSWESLQAAFQAGADAVYFGVEQLNMRARATNNFAIDDIKKIAAKCNAHNTRTYLTLNTVMYDHDLNLVKKIIDQAKQEGISAIIAHDAAVLQYADSIKMPIHLSTQANVSNIEAVKFYAQFSDMIVLARELTLKQVKNIVELIQKQNIRGPSGDLVAIEVFIHGSLCVAISGKCYMSLATYNASANRGACLQNCRRSYTVKDTETGEELVVDNEYVMSPQDLCSIDFLDQILAAGATGLKIEGRGKSADYVYVVTKCYREAVDAILAGTYTQDKVAAWNKELKTVYNRGFWEGYYLGKKLGEWTGTYGSKATTQKNYVGKICNWYAKPQVAEIILEAGNVKVGDNLLITGVTTGVFYATADSIFVNDHHSPLGKKGETITIPISAKLRKGDKVHVLTPASNEKP